MDEGFRVNRKLNMQPVYLMFIALAFLSMACGCNLGSIFSGVVGAVQGSGSSVEEAREINGIRAVEISNQGDLFVQIGEQESLIIEAQEDLLPYIKSDVRDGKLRIYTAGTQILRPTNPIRYYLTVQELDEISLTSSGDARLPEIEAEEFTIRVSSSGDLEMEGLMVERVDIQISSSGDVKIESGRVKEQHIMLSSSGDYNAGMLPSEFVRAMLSSSGNARIYVTQTLEASLSSSGDLFYRGNPTLKINVSSSGDVVPIDG
jgi:hypothetical protein